MSAGRHPSGVAETMPDLTALMQELLQLREMVREAEERLARRGPRAKRMRAKH
jgi:hypothetical protein